MGIRNQLGWYQFYYKLWWTNTYYVQKLSSLYCIKWMCTSRIGFHFSKHTKQGWVHMIMKEVKWNINLLQIPLWSSIMWKNNLMKVCNYWDLVTQVWSWNKFNYAGKKIWSEKLPLANGCKFRMGRMGRGCNQKGYWIFILKWENLETLTLVVNSLDQLALVHIWLIQPQLWESSIITWTN